MNPLTVRLHAGYLSEIFADLRFRLWESMEESKIDSINLASKTSKTMKPFVYMGYGENKLIFGITGTEEPFILAQFNLAITF